MFGAGLMSGAGGPIVKQVEIIESLFGNNFFKFLCLLVGFHRSQLGGWMRRPVMMRLLPPFMLLAVASLM